MKVTVTLELEAPTNDEEEAVEWAYSTVDVNATIKEVQAGNTTAFTTNNLP